MDAFKSDVLKSAATGAVLAAISVANGAFTPIPRGTLGWLAECEAVLIVSALLPKPVFSAVWPKSQFISRSAYLTFIGVFLTGFVGERAVEQLSAAAPKMTVIVAQQSLQEPTRDTQLLHKGQAVRISMAPKPI